MDGMIRAHCMGTEFPKRDTDGPLVKWIIPFEELKEILCRVVPFHRAGLPSAADLDAPALRVGKWGERKLADMDALESMLRQHLWDGKCDCQTDCCCPKPACIACREHYEDGHSADCWLAPLLPERDEK